MTKRMRSSRFSMSSCRRSSPPARGLSHLITPAPSSCALRRAKQRSSLLPRMGRAGRGQRSTGDFFRRRFHRAVSTLAVHRGFFDTPRGLGLAPATTSRDFLEPDTSDFSCAPDYMCLKCDTGCSRCFRMKLPASGKPATNRRRTQPSRRAVRGPYGRISP